jgi:phosphoribosyl-dephospho-CoA transferase
LRRHALIRVGADAWAAVIAARPELRDDPLLAGWAPAWPLVARRRDSGSPANTVAAGLPLPPSRGKRRHAFDLPHDAIMAIEPPPTLEHVRENAPAAWRPTLDAIRALAAAHGSIPRVFGSFAWAALTGLVYVTPTSDLDLLWPLAPGLATILAALPAIERAAPGRLDGEVVRDADGGAANWRELATRGEVLIKTLDRLTLEPVESFLDGL